MHDLLSNCCHAPMTVDGDIEEGTHFYVCSKCGMASDPAPIPGEQEMPTEKPYE